MQFFEKDKETQKCIALKKLWSGQLRRQKQIAALFRLSRQMNKCRTGNTTQVNRCPLEELVDFRKNIAL